MERALPQSFSVTVQVQLSDRRGNALTAPQRLRNLSCLFSIQLCALASVLVAVGCGGVSGKITLPLPTVSIASNPTTVAAGATATLTVAATNATKVTIAGSDGSSYTLPASGGTQTVTPSATTTYTASAIGAGGSATAASTVTVSSSGSGSSKPTV